VLDVAEGPGEAAAMALSALEPPGVVVGADISWAMLHAARRRLQSAAFQPVATDGQALADPIEAGTGQMPQAFLALPESSRRAVREEVNARLSEFESNGRIAMSLEMLIAAGRA